jgi:hypothetical protein
MPSGPLLAALAVRAIGEQEAARSRRPRPRRLARLGHLAARQDPKPPVGAGEERLGGPHRQGRRRRDLVT